MARTILVPLDGSPLAERAIPYAAALARGNGARLVLVRAVLARALPGADMTSGDIAAIEEAETVLAAEAARLRAAGIEAEPYVYCDAADAAIVDAARHHRADLIVMSTHGRGGLQRWLYGSVADSMLRQVDVPVLLVPAACKTVWPPERQPRLLVPLDGTPLAEEALGAIREVLGPLGGDLVLLTVVEPPRPHAADGAVYMAPFDAGTIAASARPYLEDQAAPLRADGFAVTTHTIVGQPAWAIPEVARGTQADLIVMASHGRGGLARLVLGSVAASVLSHASTPLLIVRPGAARRALDTAVFERRAADTAAADAVASDEPTVVTFTVAEAIIARQALRDYIRGAFEHRQPTTECQVAIAADALAQLDAATVRDVPAPTAPPPRTTHAVGSAV
jgi:nucleotide-binding universal stress UspA family protein